MMTIFKDNTYLQIVYWHSLVSNPIVNNQFSVLSIHSQMNAQTITLYTMSIHPELNSAFQSFELQWQEQTVVIPWILWVKLKKVIVKSHEQYDFILLYCTFNTDLNIIPLHWNKQHLESGIIKWRCRLLNENFHLVLVFGNMQICIGLNVEPAGLYFLAQRMNQHLPLKQTSARCGRKAYYLYSGFLNFFQVSTCSSAFWRLTSSPWSIS